MSFIWLRVAAALYSIGLLDAIFMVFRRRSPLFKPALAALGAGAVLQVVALVERAVALRSAPLQSFQDSAAFCSLLVALSFFFVHWRYQMKRLEVFLFPLVFALAVIGSWGVPDGRQGRLFRDTWLVAHVALILPAYAALLLMSALSVLYLFQERRLKTKGRLVLSDRLPPLAVLDGLIGRAMAAAFVLMTLSAAAGAVWGLLEAGAGWIAEPKIVISLVTWGLFLIMVLLRRLAGWRGRKAAYMAIAVLGGSALSWAAHIGLRGLFAP